MNENNKSWETQIEDRITWDQQVDDIIGKIENIRTKNNIQWCSVLKIALKKSPAETIALINNISVMDEEIGRELDRLAFAYKKTIRKV